MGNVTPGEWFGNQESERQLSLLEDYALGKVLGQGAFGVVYSCTRHGTNEELAVKMIDQVETRVEDIRMEVEMLSRLAHPSVVKLHDVYYEKVFVCMILDLHRGGDVIEGMQLHWKTKGCIKMPVCRRMAEMMLQGIEWLHTNNVVHRDIKGDNFLQDRCAIDDPECRIFLSDFGTAIDLPPFERLKQQCGTRAYWAPEFYARQYGLKVDIWALGVVIFGMVKGKFPFATEEDVRTLVLRCPSRFGERGGDFIRQTLDRNEPRRISARDALRHPWISSLKPSSKSEVEQAEPCFKGEVREAGANAAMRERRKVLVERLRAAKRRDSTLSSSQIRGGFEVRNEAEHCMSRFEWWTPEQVEAALFYNSATAQVVPLEDDSDTAFLACEQAVVEEFDFHGIDAGRFGRGRAKQFKEFVREVHTGQARLLLDASRHKTLARVVDIVLLRLVFADSSGRRYLVKEGESFPDGRCRDEAQLLGTKRLPFENGMQTAERMLAERLPAISGHVRFSKEVKECFEDDEDSPSYPGVRTIYRKAIYEAIMDDADKEVLRKVGLADGSDHGFSHTDREGYTRHYRWYTEEECAAREVRLKAPAQDQQVDALVPPTAGYDEEWLHEFLRGCGVDLDCFGHGGAKSLSEFSTELMEGKSELKKQADGSVIRIVDVVILLLQQPSGHTLVEVQQTYDNGIVTECRQLPAVKRRSDENPFWAAHRVLHDVVHINDILVQMDPNSVRFVEEQGASQGYGGVPTVYRRRIIPCDLSVEK